MLYKVGNMYVHSYLLCTAVSVSLLLRRFAACNQMVW